MHGRRSDRQWPGDRRQQLRSKPGLHAPPATANAKPAAAKAAKAQH
jgi:hypothetical protein